jgi:hypothetical protein
MIPTKSKLTPIQRLKIQQYNNNNEALDTIDTNNNSSPNTPLSNFDQLKSIMYSISDTLAATSTTTLPSTSSSVSSSNKNNMNKAVNRNKSNKIYDGFSTTNKAVPKTSSTTPPFTMTAFRFPFPNAEPPVVVVDVPTKPPSFLDTLKGTLYNTADLITSSSSSSFSSPLTTTKPSPKQQRMSTKSMVVKNSKNTPAINDPFTQLKEGFYSINDIFTKTIETVPMIPQKVEQTSQNTMTFVTRTLPHRAQDTVNTVTSIPNRIEQSMTNVQSTMESTMAQTKQFIQSIQALPEQVQDTVTTTQATLQSVQASLQEKTTMIQVQLGLRPPIVQPPKQVPRALQKQPPLENRLLDVAWTGTRTVGTMFGQSILWLGQTSLDMAKTKLQDTKSSAPTSTVKWDDDSDILATLQMAKDAIALAESSTSTTTITTLDRDTVVSSSTKVSVADNSNDNDDDVLDIMATLQMANDAIALAESVTITSSSSTDTADDSTDSTTGSSSSVEATNNND